MIAHTIHKSVRNWSMKAVCGNPKWINLHYDWAKVTCKNCLRKKSEKAP